MVASEAVAVPQATGKEALDFEAIFERYQTAIYNYALRVVGNREEAEDLTQETFLKVYQSLEKAGQVANFKAWIYRIATNACIDSLRRRRVIHWIPLDQLAETLPLHTSDGPEATALRMERAEVVLEVLKTLQPQYRIALLLREHQGLSYEEAGQVLGKSLSSVKSILFRARDEFRKIYIQLYGSQE